jgi:gas vesicle protein
MKKFLLGLIVGLVLGSIAVAVAYNDSTGTRNKYESSSQDAASAVVYGVYNNTLVPVLVDSAGKMQLH